MAERSAGARDDRGGTAPPAAGSFGDVLVRLAGERPNLVVITGADIGPAAWFAEVWPDRVLTVPPLMARLSIAEGIVRGGGDAVTVLEPEVVELAVRAEAGVLAVSETPAHLALAHRAALDVMQPGWEDDLPVLLVGGLSSSTTTVLFLPERTPASGSAPAPLVLGEQRVLHRGRDGLVLGAGPTAPVARAVAEALAEDHCQVTALDSHTVTGASGVEASLLLDHLLVGGLDVERAAALSAVPVGGGIPAVAERVRAALSR